MITPPAERSPAGGLEHEPSVTLDDVAQPGAGEQRAIGPHVVREGFRDRVVVDDARVRRVDGPDPGRVRLDLPEPLRADDLQALRSVRVAPAKQLFEAGKLGLVQRHDDLAAQTVGDAAFVAEPPQHPRAGRAEAGLVRAGRVVEPGVDDAAVVAGLVGPDPVLFLDDRYSEAGMPAAQRHRRRQADDPASHNGDVVAA